MQDRKRNHLLLVALIAALLPFRVVAQSSVTLQVDAGKVGAPIQPTMWGIFFEDINFAADGGIYAEMIKNRSFEFADPRMGWQEHKYDRFSLNRESGSMTIINRVGKTTNPRFARVTTNASKGYGITNEGFRGMGVKQGGEYVFSVLASQHQGGKVTLRLELVDEKGSPIGEASLTPEGVKWKKYSVNITATRTEARAKLNIWFEGTGTVDLDIVSLFPADTWKRRPNGLRADLVQLLADLKPGFLRFPGGCIVEGRDLATRYQWKKTVGPVEDRHLIINRWNTEFRHRPTPDYFQSFGLGFFEYFQLAEDLGAEPLPILSCGMACQFNSAEVVPLDQLDPYIEDALDLIEFANGSTDTPWGKVRADMGHPEPFKLKFIGIGNEQWGPGYIERYKLFVDAIKSKYPDVTIVSGSGPFPDGEMFEYGWEELRELKAEIVDEHYYRPPEWFFENATRYDSYDRSGPKVFAGEYAAQSVAIASPENKNNWRCALSEAAFMTGLERNADVVYLTSYAPLFAHVDGWQWTPDLIWFDNLKSFGTPNYYVQKLFSNNRGTHVVSVQSNGKPLTGPQVYATAAVDRNTNELILKIVNASESTQPADIRVDGIRGMKTGTVTVLKSADPEAVNSIDNPLRISPETKPLKASGRKLDIQLDPLSLTVVRVPIR
ncbi:MAG TPA: alpha-L-arabinofuranosidase C-terminal domain-containing protein [Cyclobacteriaceae bacterium]|jgi:alpha-N-arabinofuranosidase